MGRSEEKAVLDELAHLFLFRHSHGGTQIGSVPGGLPSPGYTPGLEVVLVPHALPYGVKVKSWLVTSPPEISTGARDDFIA